MKLCAYSWHILYSQRIFSMSPYMFPKRVSIHIFLFNNSIIFSWKHSIRHFNLIMAFSNGMLVSSPSYKKTME